MRVQARPIYPGKAAEFGVTCHAAASRSARRTRGGLVESCPSTANVGGTGFGISCVCVLIQTARNKPAANALK